MVRGNAQVTPEDSDRTAWHTIHIKSQAAKNRKEIGQKTCETIRENPWRLKQSA